MTLTRFAVITIAMSDIVSRTVEAHRSHPGNYPTCLRQHNSILARQTGQSNCTIH